jgi:beta-barrel assembly-enhancing protease
MSGFFFNLGRKIGRATVPAIRKSKWIWDDLTGSEEEALRAERALGTGLAAELRHATEPSRDAELSTRANEVCRRLAERLQDSARVFRCEVFRTDLPNAIGLPGGFIFLSDSLIRFCDGSVDELAFLIGHEMAHIVSGHARERMLSQTALGAASAVASYAGPAGAWFHHKGRQLLQSAHSRKCEREADAQGMRLATAAGYDPAGALTLLQRVGSLNVEETGHYFASHPPATERIIWLSPPRAASKPENL